MSSSLKHLARRAAGVVLWIVCAALALIARLRHGQDSYRPDSVERILIIRLDLIGDLLFSVPAIRNTRQRFPHARLDVLVAPNTAPLLAECPYINHVYTLDTHTLTHLPGFLSLSRWRQAWRLIRTLRAQRYELCLSLYGVPAATVSLLTGAPQRAGFADEAPPGSFTLRATGSRLPQDRHEVHCSLAVAQAAGAATTPDRMEAWVSAADRAWAEGTLATDGNALWVACGHGARNGYAKIWPRRHWVGLIDQLQKTGYRAVLVGGPEEVEEAAAIAHACESAPLVLTGKTTLGQLAAVLAQVTLMVGSDSGPLHLAVALGTSVVGLYGATSPVRYGPFGQPDAVRRHPIFCSPCYRPETGQPATCRYGTVECMEELEPEQVLAGEHAAIGDAEQ
ncbi:MAG: glycosyltransferase family 9 protein [Chloroflexi bacterium]|nr:glycosyltransferase family 9 protein [Chloroflexota bacterium]